MRRYAVVGLMSGTSLDGLDIAACTFTHSENKWTFSIVDAATIPYPDALLNQLRQVHNVSALQFCETDNTLGNFIGQSTSNFLNKTGFDADFIASHGHTVFHQPEQSLTVQIGNPAAIAAKCSLPVVADFRRLDVALGGQGAPLVPIGDTLLFDNYDACLNLGGIANISFEENGKRLAFDVCVANMALNALSMTLGLAYDEGGKLAAGGKLNKGLLNSLNALDFFKEKGPKSLGREWVEDAFLPILAEAANTSVEDKLATVVEHIAIQIGKYAKKEAQLLATGGGALNSFLIERIAHHWSGKVTVPEQRIVEFKEALIFAFLGVLRMEQQLNCLESVTGSTTDNCGGAIYHHTAPT